VEHFVIEIEHKGKPVAYEANLQITGFTHRILIFVEEVEVIFERDDQNEYRAIVAPTHMDKVNVKLLAAIAAQLDEAFK
jgi:hypothetical protein